MPSQKLVLNKDVLSGLLFAAAGAGFLVLAQDYEMGSGRRMGPGLFPTILSVALVAVGVVTVLRGWIAGAGPVGKITWRGLGLVSGATVLFGLLLHPAGLLPAALCLILVSALGSRETRSREMLLLAVGLATFAVAVFVYGLGLPLQAFGPLLGG
jgi:putative tricarboxylic transport membrane protein